jgi:hypothetical protein
VFWRELPTIQEVLEVWFYSQSLHLFPQLMHHMRRLLTTIEATFETYQRSLGHVPTRN